MGPGGRGAGTVTRKFSSDFGCRHNQILLGKEYKSGFLKDFIRICAPPEFQTFRHPWYGFESAVDSATRDIIMCVHGKGGLISL